MEKNERLLDELHDSSRLLPGLLPGQTLGAQGGTLHRYRCCIRYDLASALISVVLAEGWVSAQAPGSSVLGHHRLSGADRHTPRHEPATGGTEVRPMEFAQRLEGSGHVLDHVRPMVAME